MICQIRDRLLSANRYCIFLASQVYMFPPPPELGQSLILPPSKMSDTAAPIELPVIDISDPNDPAVGKAMLDAAAKYGFLYVNSKGSDFTVEDVDRGFGLVCTEVLLILTRNLTVAIVQKVLRISCSREGTMSHYGQRQ